MKMLIKILSIIIAIVLIADIAASLYFYNISVARNKKDFLARDSALINNAAQENVSALAADVPVNAKVFVAKEVETVEIDWFNKQPYEEVQISSDDGLKLEGYYLGAKVATNKTAILAHGYSSKGMWMGSFAKIYYDLGYNVLLPDSRGHGRSEGNFIGFGWPDRKDYLKWIDYVINRVGQDSQIVLHGVSMGGTTVLMTSGEILPSAVKAIISDCAYTSVEAELKYQMKRMYKLPSFPILDTTSLVTKMLAGYSFREASALEQVKKSKTPTLFIHGDADKFVPYSMVHELYQACSSEKELFTVKSAGHGNAFDTDIAGYKSKIKDFVDKYTK